jgi:pimeloyl-ACP methyl ester carboxylesterase
VLGGRSNVFSDDDRARLFSISSCSAGRVHAHVLPGAGHWLHVDDPDGLFALISGSL